MISGLLQHHLKESTRFNGICYISVYFIGAVIVNDENENVLGIFTVTDALNALIEIASPSLKNT